MRRRLLLALALIAGGLVALAPPAAAGQGGGGGLGSGSDNNGPGGDDVTAWSAAYASHRSGSASPIPCTIEQPVFDEEGNPTYNPDGSRIMEVKHGFITYEQTLNSQETLIGATGETREGRFIRVECNGEGIIDDNLRTLLRVPFIVAIEDLLDVSLERMDLPEPPIQTSPGGTQPQLVNLPTWLWLDPGYWEPRSITATADAGLVTISTTVTAQPESVRWDMGDGGVEPCDGPGTPYDPARPAASQATDCGYTYRRASVGGAYPLTATVTWTGSYTVSIGGGGDLGSIDITSDPVPVRVAESQAVVGD